MSEYYTYRIRLNTDNFVRVEKRSPAGAVLGEPSGQFRYTGDLKATIDRLTQKAYANELKDDEPIKQLGEALFEALFDDVLRNDFVSLYNTAVHQESSLLRLELDINEALMPAVAALPWEFLRLPLKANLGTLWLGSAPDVIFSRRRQQWFMPRPIQLSANEKLRIALAVAAPADLGKVEYEKVVAGLKKLVESQPDKFDLLPVVTDADADKIDQLLAQNPHIFHFIGHGRLPAGDHTEGQIALVDGIFGEAYWVDADFFSDLLNTHRPGVVVLQACEGGMLSASQAFVGVASRIVQQNIPVVVAMQYEVSNTTAVRFAVKFYQNLAEGYPVDWAAQNGRRAIALNTQYKSRDFATPVLFMRVADGQLFTRPSSNSQGSPMAVTPVAGDTIGGPQAPVPLTAEAASLPKLIADKFDLEGIRTLCEAVGVDFEDLGSPSKTAKAQDLFGKAERIYRLDALAKAMVTTTPGLLPHIKANLYVFMERLKSRELTSVCQELRLDCVALKLDSAGLLGYEANKYIRTERTKGLQDFMVSNGRYPELVQAVKKYLPSVDFTLFEM
ncbi:MAG: CHAT domain-containing protein [Chloroflexi bacterium]|nr:CHAT domain-containing protein [Chloroflexota bacterium]